MLKTADYPLLRCFNKEKDYDRFDPLHGFLPEPPAAGKKSLSAPACLQPGGLVSLGGGSLRKGPAGG
ncbi:hypothetical cytosolic protein [Syntrophus aciditrophicus SB]|uniref:Hypothetical cytosolic protein n=1 Tax=Syntrophus aciditrophicus (strain SB) TaxID=56780 RepID=Q2LQ61_SYNAS|nr:hypothetical cytosolic protein [Syntrophus aciditrophicus SB]